MATGRKRYRETFYLANRAAVYNSNGDVIQSSIVPPSTLEGPKKVIQDVIDKRRGPNGSIVGYVDPSGLLITDEREVPTSFTYTLNYQNGNPYVRGPVRVRYSRLGESVVRNALLSKEPTEQVLLEQLINRSVPSQPLLSVPIFLAEMVELTTLFKLVLNNAVTLVGSGTLQYNFGWRPFLSDLRSLHSVTSAIELKIKEFNSLLGKGGLSRKIQLGSYSHTESTEPKPLVTSFATIVGGVTTNTYTSKIWGTVRWFPRDGEPIPVKELEQFNAAVKAVFDLQGFSWRIAWEIIPFSWLIDYLVNIGPKLTAVENVSKFQPKHICLMWDRKVETSRTSISIDSPGVVLNTSGSYTGRFRRRKVFSEYDVLQSVGFSFLTQNEVVNISALLARFANNHEDFLTRILRRL